MKLSVKSKDDLAAHDSGWTTVSIRKQQVDAIKKLSAKLGYRHSELVGIALKDFIDNLVITSNGAKRKRL